MIDSVVIIASVSSFLVIVTYLFQQSRRRDRTSRELARVDYHMVAVINYIEMARETPHGPDDRDVYLDLAIGSARDTQIIVTNLSKEI